MKIAKHFFWNTTRTRDQTYKNILPGMEPKSKLLQNPNLDPTEHLKIIWTWTKKWSRNWFKPEHETEPKFNLNSNFNSESRH